MECESGSGGEEGVVEVGGKLESGIGVYGGDRGVVWVECGCGGIVW